ncbi:hypothetical protein BDL97_15G020700 [Sphagnum fallax]|nr:hypothetical protein BDL97_15G020700 [Sphagnum fallax]
MNRGQLSIQVHSLCEIQGTNSQLSRQKPLYVNVQTLSNSRKELQSEKDAGVNMAEWDAQDLKGQLEELRSHHTTTLGQLMETVTTGTAVCFCACNSAVGTNPSHLYIFQGTTSLEVTSSYAPMNVFCLTVYLFVFSFLTRHGILHHKAHGQHL